MAADETALGDLHNKVALVLSDLLDGTELPTGEQNDDGEEIKQVMPPSAATITAAIQFLKNNNITCTPAKDNALGELQEKIAAREARRKARPSAADFSLASADAGFMMGTAN